MQKQAAPLLGPAEVEGSDARANGGQLSEGRVLGNCNSEKIGILSVSAILRGILVLKSTKTNDFVAIYFKSKMLNTA